MDNVITFTPKKTDNRSIEDRIYECFHATLMFDIEHQQKCIYCLHNASTGKMLFDILVKDMSDAAKNKHLSLTVYDLRNVLSIVLQHINKTENDVLREQYELEENKRQEAGKVRLEAVRGIESRSQEVEKTESTVDQGITEVYPDSPGSGED